MTFTNLPVQLTSFIGREGELAEVERLISTSRLVTLTGASIVAIMRNRQLIANPKSLTVFEAGDRVGFIGDPEQIEAVERLLSAPETADSGVEWET